MRALIVVVLAIVVLANADATDNVRVVSFRSIAVRALVRGPVCCVVRLVSEPCSAPTGDSCASPSNRRAPALRQASEVDNNGPTTLGVALFRLARLEIRGVHHESLHCYRMASQGVSPVLEVENTAWQARTTDNTEGNSRADSHHESRKPDLGRSENPWRTAQTRNRDRRNQCQ